MRYHHIVFDVDGTLLDTEEAILQSFQKTLREHAGIEKDLSELSFCLGITGARLSNGWKPVMRRRYSFNGRKIWRL